MGDTKPFSRYVFFLTGKLSAFKNNDLTKPKVSAIAEYGGGKVVQRASGKVTHVLTGSAQTEDPKAELPPWKKKLKETVIYLDNEDFLKLCKKHKVDSSKAPDGSTPPEPPTSSEVKSKADASTKTKKEVGTLHFVSAISKNKAPKEVIDLRAEDEKKKVSLKKKDSTSSSQKVEKTMSKSKSSESSSKHTSERKDSKKKGPAKPARMKSKSGEDSSTKSENSQSRNKGNGKEFLSVSTNKQFLASNSTSNEEGPTTSREASVSRDSGSGESPARKKPKKPKKHSPNHYEKIEKENTHSKKRARDLESAEMPKKKIKLSPSTEKLWKDKNKRRPQPPSFEIKFLFDEMIGPEWAAKELK